MGSDVILAIGEVIIALVVVVGSVVWLIVHPTDPVPALLTMGVGVVVTFFFAQRTAAAIAKAVSDAREEAAETALRLMDQTKKGT